MIFDEIYGTVGELEGEGLDCIGVAKACFGELIDGQDGRRKRGRIIVPGLNGVDGVLGASLHLIL